MASAFAHAAAALALAAALPARDATRLVIAGGVALSILPDVDVLGFGLGIPYEHPLGHRGLTHSLAFAALIGVGVAGFLRHRGRWPVVAVYLFACVASHGVLDAMTTGGLGVAFFAPFSNRRYFFSLRPILVSPLSPVRFLSARGLAILWSELLWVGIPCAFFAIAARSMRRMCERGTLRVASGDPRREVNTRP